MILYILLMQPSWVCSMYQASAIASTCGIRHDSCHRARLVEVGHQRDAREDEVQANEEVVAAMDLQQAVLGSIAISKTMVAQLLSRMDTNAAVRQSTLHAFGI